mmetsp:Transcript_14507/g.39694  ORF Transcript_14507/g.39694 Transcript_14507/m.39694 type:complete len:219 (+) Transcript_14507:157-813(+)
MIATCIGSVLSCRVIRARGGVRGPATARGGCRSSVKVTASFCVAASISARISPVLVLAVPLCVRRSGVSSAIVPVVRFVRRVLVAAVTGFEVWRRRGRSASVWRILRVAAVNSYFGAGLALVLAALGLNSILADLGSDRRSILRPHFSSARRVRPGERVIMRAGFAHALAKRAEHLERLRERYFVVAGCGEQRCGVARQHEVLQANDDQHGPLHHLSH